MQHEVQCICSVPKLSSKYQFETTVTFVNRDGKPGNYVNCSGTRSHYIADAPLFVNVLTIILRQDYMMVALHTLPILILIIVQLPNPFKKLY
jgi:hypothetical protein